MFSTPAVMFSPYNYHWYRPATAHKLWNVPQPEIWHGKNHPYIFPWYKRWWRSYSFARVLYNMNADREWQDQALAFVQGSHPRLGAESLIRLLDPLMLQRVLPRPYNG